MPRIAFPNFCGPTNPTRGISFDLQRCINMYPEKGLPSSRGEYMLVQRPGLQTYETLAASPVRALWAGLTRLFAVSGTHFYELNNTGGIVTDYGAIPGSSGVGPATIVQNGGSASFQLVVWDSSVNQLFTPSAGSIGTSKFNATWQEYLDGFSVAIATGASLQNAGQPNQINVSAFGDPTNWTPAAGSTQAFVIRTGASDLCTGLVVLQGLLWIFGQKSVEIWYDAGNSPFPFARYQGATINLGLASPASLVKFYNTLMWLGGDDRGYVQVYMAQGMSPVRVSTPAVESIIEQIGPSQIAIAWAYGYQEDGHTFYVLNFPVSGYGSVSNTLVYDITEGLWHERSSAQVPTCSATVPGFTATNAHFVGDMLSGKVMYQSLAFAADVGNTIACIRYAPYVSDMNRVSLHRRFEVAGTFGTANPQITYTDDYGVNYKTAAYQMAAAGNSAQPADHPQFKRYYAMQLGRSRARVYKFQVNTDTVNPVSIAGAYLDIGDMERL